MSSSRPEMAQDCVRAGGAASEPHGGHGQMDRLSDPRAVYVCEVSGSPQLGFSQQSPSRCQPRAAAPGPRLKEPGISAGAAPCRAPLLAASCLVSGQPI